MTLCTERSRTLDDIRAFLGGNEAADITPHDREAAYAFIERALVRFRYHLGLSRAGKGLVREFLAKVTGYSDAQLSRLIAQQRRTPDPRPPAASSRPARCTTPTRCCWPRWTRRLAPSGRRSRILWRQYHVFGDERFERLARISTAASTAGSPGVPECPDHVPGDPGGDIVDRQAAQTPAGGPAGCTR